MWETINKTGGETKMFDKNKNDQVIKLVAVIVLVIIAFAISIPLLGRILGNGYMMNSGFYGINLTGILTILLKILLFVSVLGLVIGLGVFLYQNYCKSAPFNFNFTSKTTCPNCQANSSSEFKFCPTCGKSIRGGCNTCGNELKAEWKCCPNCGSEKEVKKTAEVKKDEVKI